MNLRAWQKQFLEQTKSAFKHSAPAIYADSMLGARIASLRVTYASVVHLIGQIAFDCIASSYFLSSTESPVDIGLIGREFPDYLEQHNIMHHLPYISDLARFEWQRHIVFETTEKSQTHNAVIGHYDYPVDQIWACCQKDYTGNFELDLTRQKIDILMFRFQLHVIIQRIAKP